MQCQRVILLVLGLVCMIHAMPTLQYKLLSEKTGQFVKLHSNGQVTADALRVGKCVEVCYSVLCVVLAFTWSPSLSLLLFFFLFFFFFNAWLLGIIAITDWSLGWRLWCWNFILSLLVQMLALSWWLVFQVENFSLQPQATILQSVTVTQSLH